MDEFALKIQNEVNGVPAELEPSLERKEHTEKTSETFINSLATVWTPPSWDWLEHYKYSSWSFDFLCPIFWKLLPEAGDRNQTSQLGNPNQTETIHCCSTDYSKTKNSLTRGGHYTGFHGTLEFLQRLPTGFLSYG